MYKIFSGEKCIIISSAEAKNSEKNAKTISFLSAEALHRELKLFSKSKLKKLFITGDEERIWKVFRSLFVYIESSGGVVKNEKGNLLMIYRNRHWDLPKGKLEKGESPGMAAIREVEEECGVKHLRIVKQFPSSHHIFYVNKVQHLKRTYWYEMLCRDSAKPKPQAEEGIKIAKWMRKEEVKKVSNKIYSSLREILIAASFLS
ncbi:MAG: NUDIX domain-containing protein [Bacteroidetes bacterium]|nr:NUDIX domain-containing protein [Bacteroidota bacterium]